jgi:hypothetical protein
MTDRAGIPALILVSFALTVFACMGCSIPCKCEGGGPGPVPMEPFDAGDAGDAMSD